jgi:selenoprotein W-related protein
LAEAIVSRFRTPIGTAHPIQELILVPSGRGIFDVYADGELIYSKYETGRHADPGEVLAAIAAKLG